MNCITMRRRQSTVVRVFFNYYILIWCHTDITSFVIKKRNQDLFYWDPFRLDGWLVDFVWIYGRVVCSLEKRASWHLRLSLFVVAVKSRASATLIYLPETNQHKENIHRIQGKVDRDELWCLTYFQWSFSGQLSIHCWTVTKLNFQKPHYNNWFVSISWVR